MMKNELLFNVTKYINEVKPQIYKINVFKLHKVLNTKKHNFLFATDKLVLSSYFPNYRQRKS